MDVSDDPIALNDDISVVEQAS
jgi:hypothetical protein